MARQYKLLTNHEKDSSNSSGGWNRVAYFKKDTPSSSGVGTLEKVKVNFLVDDIDGSTDPRPSFPFGHFFALSRTGSLSTVDGESNMLDPSQCIDITARNGGGGVATLYANHAKIAENTTDTSEGDGYIHLWQKNTDLTASDNIIMRYYIETYGRWVECADV